jgi:hypothetical protein
MEEEKIERIIRNIIGAVVWMLGFYFVYVNSNFLTAIGMGLICLATKIEIERIK